MIRTTLALILASTLLVGCPPVGPDPVTPPNPSPNPNPEPNPPRPDPAPSSDPTAAMCAHLQKLGCEEGESVYNDDLPGPVDVPNQSCTDFHKDLAKDGINVNPKCVRRTPSCRDIESYRAMDPKDC